MPSNPEKTSAASDPLEKAEAKKEKGQAATEGFVSGKALDDALGDDGGVDPEQTSAADDPLEKAEAAKEKKH